MPVSPPDAPVEADDRALAVFARALGDAKTMEEQDAVRVAALRAAGIAPIAPGRARGSTEAFRVGKKSLVGWVIGREPVRRDTLVVVSAPRDGMSDLALAEAARMLVARSVFTQTPARSVLVVIGDPVPALRFWDRARMHAAIRVGAGPDSLAGLPVQRVPLGEAEDLAVRLHGILVRETTPGGSIYTSDPLPSE
ncbi:MAG: hypothetical protein AAGI52_16230 [Bacteroidota bacterium]